MRVFSGPDLRGRVLGGHYRLDEVLGTGATGIVFRARHDLLDEDFAVKVLNPELAGDEELRERFLREARSLTRFVHPCAVQVRHCGEDDGLLYLVMDLCGGESLDALLEREGRLPPARAVQLALRVLAALEEAHKAGIVHRDLKPANIMVDNDAVRVVDFGLARILGTDTNPAPAVEVTMVGAIVGTLAYMSPEQMRGDGADGRSDLFALGLVLHEMISGERAFGTGTPVTMMRRILDEPLPPLPRDVGAEVPPDLRKALKRALDKNPNKRYQTSAAFAEALRAATGEGPSPKRRWWVPTVATLLLIAVSLSAWFYLKDREVARLRTVAREAYLDARFEETIEHLSLLVQADRAAPDDYLLRARARILLHRPEARADVTRAGDLLPNDPRVPTLEGELHWMLGHFEDAQHAFEVALRTDEGHLPARLAMVELQMDVAGRATSELMKRIGSGAAASRIDDAREKATGTASTVDRLMKDLKVRAPDDERVTVLESQRAQQRLRDDAARALAEQATRRDPGLAEAAHRLASALQTRAEWHRGRGQDVPARALFEQALKQIDAAIARAKARRGYHDQGRHLLRYYLARALIHIRLHEYEAASADIGEVFRRNPRDPWNCRECGTYATQIGDYEFAIQRYEFLLAIGNDDPKHFFRLAFSFQQIGGGQRRRGEVTKARANYERAIQIYDQGLALDPHYALLNNYRAEAATRLAEMTEGDERARLLAEARRYFDAVGNENEKDNFRQALWYRISGDTEAALAAMEKEVEVRLTPAMWARLTKLRVEVARERKDRALLQKAIAAAQHMQRFQPNKGAVRGWVQHGNALRLLAEWDHDSKRLEEAVAAYRAGVDVAGDLPWWRAEARYLAADTLLDLERSDDAAAEARKGFDVLKQEAQAGRWFRLQEDYARLADLLERAGKKDEAAAARAKADAG